MKILIIPGLTLPSVSAADLQRIRDAAGPGAELVVTSQAQAHEHAEAAEVILGFVPHALFQAAPRLRWVHAIASGVDAFLYPEFAASPVLLTSEKGLVGEHLADHAFGLLLMLTRQLATALKLGPDAWNHRPEMRRKEIELTGLTMGIVDSVAPDGRWRDARPRSECAASRSIGIRYPLRPKCRRCTASMVSSICWRRPTS